MSLKHWLYLIGAIILAFWFGKNYGINSSRSQYVLATYPPDASEYPTAGTLPL